MHAIESNGETVKTVAFFLLWLNPSLKAGENERLSPDVSFDNPRGAVYKSDVFFPVSFSTRFQNDMTKIALIFSLLVLCASFAVAAQPETMRVDYYHTGDLTSEVFSLDRVVIEPLPWPGNLAQSIDNLLIPDLDR